MAELYLAVVVDEETYEALKQLAARKGRDVPSLLRDAVRVYLALSKPMPVQPRLVRIHGRD